MQEKIAMLEPEHPQLSMRWQCQTLGISRSNLYYQPQTQGLSDEKLALLRLCDETYTAHPFFGTRQMSDYLQLQGYDIERHHVRWAYEKLGLRSLAPGPHTSTPHPEHKVYPYLLRGVKARAPKHIWSTDITYIRLEKGFVYLMAIIDWFSRYVLDWELSISLDADFCIDTLERVLVHQKCDIFNTDQGCQFTSNAFTKVLHDKEIRISMDGKGRALDNVFVERLWRSVKYECVYLYDWQHVKEARDGLRDYFEFYNHRRPHQSLDGVTPATVYNNAIH